MAKRLKIGFISLKTKHLETFVQSILNLETYRFRHSGLRRNDGLLIGLLKFNQSLFHAKLIKVTCLSIAFPSR